MANQSSRGKSGSPEGKKTKAPAKSGGKSGGKSTTKNKAPAKAPSAFPGRFLAAAVSIAVFFVLLMVSIKPEGLILKALKAFLLGMVGRVGFYLLIPGTLMLFVINAGKRRGSTRGQSLCVLFFILCCACIHHLLVQRQGIASGAALFADLYVGGSEGISAGVLCGGLAMLVRWAVGTPVAMALFIVAGLLTLMGTFGVTLPGLARAIANLPKDEWEDEPYEEPSQLVVNHIANRQKQRSLQKQKAFMNEEVFREAPPEPAPRGKKPRIDPDAPINRAAPQPQQEQPQPNPQPVQETPDPAYQRQRMAEFMNTIALDVTAPVASSGVAVHPDPEEFPEENISSTPFFHVPPQKDPNFLEDTIEDFEEEPVRPAPKVVSVKPKAVRVSESHPESRPDPRPEPVIRQPIFEEAVKKTEPEAPRQPVPEAKKSQGNPEYVFPPLDLLKAPFNTAQDGTDEMRENSRRLNETLASFHIDAHITNVTRGPSVTRYEIELDRGVRLNKVTNCADDIALSLGASGVRIAAVPGKISIVGIEVPNRSVTTVSLREVIGSSEFASAKSKSSFSVGKDIGGNCIVGNIAKMPHMLIAGTTGSGKSVCMNSIIISLLYKAAPQDVKLIMVDPKMVELGIYNGIPHLLIPVVTDPKKAAGSLQWAVTEMLRRYKLMSDAGVRDLESYNAIARADGAEPLPQVVIIIDELADLMLVAAKEVEDSICRIAQMGRASGMHLIIATQRPSADVITGLMKANIPSRIAFSVASAMESRIILDTQGAEKLVGKGDMLFAPIGCGKPMRVQGCFVTDGEVEAVASYVKDHYTASYNQEVLEDIEKKALQTGKGGKAAQEPEPSEDTGDGDEMLPAAVDVILETGQASVSMLQRRLKLGYARAARIVDEMEEKGIVGPFQGSKPRAILVTKDQWAAMRGGAEMEDPEDMPF